MLVIIVTTDHPSTFLLHWNLHMCPHCPHISIATATPSTPDSILLTFLTFKPYSFHQGILTCYELHEVFPDPSLLVLLPSSPNPALQVPVSHLGALRAFACGGSELCEMEIPEGSSVEKKKNVSITAKLT